MSHFSGLIMTSAHLITAIYHGKVSQTQTLAHFHKSTNFDLVKSSQFAVISQPFCVSPTSHTSRYHVYDQIESQTMEKKPKKKKKNRRVSVSYSQYPISAYTLRTYYKYTYVYARKNERHCNDPGMHPRRRARARSITAATFAQQLRAARARAGGIVLRKIYKR